MIMVYYIWCNVKYFVIHVTWYYNLFARLVGNVLLSHYLWRHGYKEWRQELRNKMDFRFNFDIDNLTEMVTINEQ